ncbi:MAG: hypothetical protein JW937_00765 [Candidatus Omnitrophica bacterium]|nr:hypothetical protein [Candidatus Omnitrophota bacterium]
MHPFRRLRSRRLLPLFLMTALMLGIPGLAAVTRAQEPATLAPVAPFDGEITDAEQFQEWIRTSGVLDGIRGLNSAQQAMVVLGRLRRFFETRSDAPGTMQRAMQMAAREAGFEVPAIPAATVASGPMGRLNREQMVQTMLDNAKRSSYPDLDAIPLERVVHLVNSMDPSTGPFPELGAQFKDYLLAALSEDSPVKVRVFRSHSENLTGDPGRPAWAVSEQVFKMAEGGGILPELHIYLSEEYFRGGLFDPQKASLIAEELLQEVGESIPPSALGISFHIHNEPVELAGSESRPEAFTHTEMASLSGALSGNLIPSNLVRKSETSNPFYWWDWCRESTRWLDEHHTQVDSALLPLVTDVTDAVSEKLQSGLYGLVTRALEIDRSGRHPPQGFRDYVRALTNNNDLAGLLFMEQQVTLFQQSNQILNRVGSGTLLGFMQEDIYQARQRIHARLGRNLWQELAFAAQGSPSFQTLEPRRLEEGTLPGLEVFEAEFVNLLQEPLRQRPDPELAAPPSPAARLEMDWPDLERARLNLESLYNTVLVLGTTQSEDAQKLQNLLDANLRTLNAARLVRESLGTPENAGSWGASDAIEQNLGQAATRLQNQLRLLRSGLVPLTPVQSLDTAYLASPDIRDLGPRWEQDLPTYEGTLIEILDQSLEDLHQIHDLIQSNRHEAAWVQIAAQSRLALNLASVVTRLSFQSEVPPEAVDRLLLQGEFDVNTIIRSAMEQMGQSNWDPAYEPLLRSGAPSVLQPLYQILSIWLIQPDSDRDIQDLQRWMDYLAIQIVWVWQPDTPEMGVGAWILNNCRVPGLQTPDLRRIRRRSSKDLDLSPAIMDSAGMIPNATELIRTLQNLYGAEVPYEIGEAIRLLTPEGRNFVRLYVQECLTGDPSIISAPIQQIARYMPSRTSAAFKSGLSNWLLQDFTFPVPYLAGNMGDTWKQSYGNVWRSLAEASWIQGIWGDETRRDGWVDQIWEKADAVGEWLPATWLQIEDNWTKQELQQAILVLRAHDPNQYPAQQEKLLQIVGRYRNTIESRMNRQVKVAFWEHGTIAIASWIHDEMARQLEEAGVRTEASEVRTGSVVQALQVQTLSIQALQSAL